MTHLGLSAGSFRSSYGVRGEASTLSLTVDGGGGESTGKGGSRGVSDGASTRALLYKQVVQKQCEISSK